MVPRLLQLCYVMSINVLYALALVVSWIALTVHTLFATLNHSKRPSMLREMSTWMRKDVSFPGTRKRY
jgi:hypothetical protein